MQNNTRGRDNVYQCKFREPAEPTLVLALFAQCNGTIQLTGTVPKKIQPNVHCAMKNSRYDYFMCPKTGNFEIFIKRTRGKTCSEQLDIIKKCANKLAKRAGVRVTIKTKT
jgi:hypothetical protein